MTTKSTTTVKKPLPQFVSRTKLPSGAARTKASHLAKPVAPHVGPGKPKWSPHSYQRKGVKFLLEHGAAALFLDPGLGKTSMTLAAAKVLRKEGVMRGMLVVAPLRPAITTWPNEVSKWKDFEDTDLVVLHGKDFEKLCREQHDVYVTNYDSLRKLFKMEKVNKIWKYSLTDSGKALMSHVDTLVWDELSKMKNSGTQRYKLVKPHLKKFLRRWGLTGSPASNGLLDLFGECYVLDEGRTLGAFITHYRSQYFTANDDEGYSFRVKDGATDLIYERLRPLALVMEAKDYLELPQQLDHVIKFDLPPAVRTQYEELEDEFLTMIGEDLVTASNMAAASSKCRQICSGAIYLHELDPITGAPRKRSQMLKPWVQLHDEKLDLLEDLVDELNGQQLLVAYDFNHDLERLLKRFPNTPFIGGGVSTKRGVQLEKEWNAGDHPIIFAHPASVAYGLNLQGSNAAHVAWFTLTWDFELYNQFIKRILRQGNTADHIHIYSFVAKNSVEESVMYALRRKERGERALKEALKTKRRI